MTWKEKLRPVFRPRSFEDSELRFGVVLRPSLAMTRIAEEERTGLMAIHEGYVEKLFKANTREETMQKERELAPPTLEFSPCHQSFFVTFDSTFSGWASRLYRIGRFQNIPTVFVSTSDRGAFFIYVQGEIERAVRCAVNDDGNRWEFFQRGEPLAFENTDTYKNRKVRARFTKQVLADYLVALDIDLDILFDYSFPTVFLRTVDTGGEDEAANS